MAKVPGMALSNKSTTLLSKSVNCHRVGTSRGLGASFIPSLELVSYSELLEKKYKTQPRPPRVGG